MYINELTLVKDFTKILKTESFQFLGNKKYDFSNQKLLQEVNIGYGIPDIVCTFSKKKVYVRKSKKSLNDFDIHILEVLKDLKTVKFCELEEILFSNKNYIKKSINRLEMLGIIKIAKNDIISFEKYEEIIDFSIAFEAKLRDWKRALKQAYRYKWFANMSYVIMPSEYSKGAIQSIQEFKDNNIGLVIYFKDLKSFEVINKPLPKEPISHKMRMLLNEIAISNKFSY